MVEHVGMCVCVCRSTAANANSRVCSNWIWMICSRLPSVWQHVAAIAGNRCRVFIFYAATGGSVSKYASHVNTINCIVHNLCANTLTHKCNPIVKGSMCVCGCDAKQFTITSERLEKPNNEVDGKLFGPRNIFRFNWALHTTHKCRASHEKCTHISNCFECISARERTCLWIFKRNPSQNSCNSTSPDPLCAWIESIWYPHDELSAFFSPQNLLPWKEIRFYS